MQWGKERKEEQKKSDRLQQFDPNTQMKCSPSSGPGPMASSAFSLALHLPWNSWVISPSLPVSSIPLSLSPSFSLSLIASFIPLSHSSHPTHLAVAGLSIETSKQRMSSLGETQVFVLTHTTSHFYLCILFFLFLLLLQHHHHNHNHLFLLVFLFLRAYVNHSCYFVLLLYHLLFSTTTTTTTSYLLEPSGCNNVSIYQQTHYWNIFLCRTRRGWLVDRKAARWTESSRHQQQPQKWHWDTRFSTFMSCLLFSRHYSGMSVLFFTIHTK